MIGLSNNDLIGLLSPLQVVAVVEAALRAEVAGEVTAPKRLHVQWDGNNMLTMPAAAKVGMGVKIVSVVPSNTARGLPVTNGLMVLNDSETGVPVAILNATTLTALRTGAVGALGVKYLTRQETCSVGIVGCGMQAAWQAIFACAVRPIREAFVFCRSMVGFEQLAETVNRHAQGVRLTSCQSARELLERTDLVMTATTSSEPVLPDEPRLLENKHFISVGSYRPNMQELPDSVYRLAGLLAVDSEHACHEAGDVINPLRKGILKETDVFSIAECVTGKRTLDTARTTAFKSVGAAIYDLYVAQALYARAQGLGCEIDL